MTAAATLSFLCSQGRGEKGAGGRQGTRIHSMQQPACLAQGGQRAPPEQPPPSRNLPLMTLSLHPPC
jgi:hypothetical protein